jgi:N utilization substance protein B
MDSRHQQRVKILEELYAHGFYGKGGKPLGPVSDKTKTIIDNRDKIYAYITKFASKFPIDKIAKIDLAILCLSIYELAIEKKEPPKVVINEAIELAKEYGADRSFAFTNAVLGKVYNEIYEK